MVNNKQALHAASWLAAEPSIHMNLKRVVTLRRVLNSHIDFIIHMHAMLREKSTYDDQNIVDFERQHDSWTRLW